MMAEYGFDAETAQQLLNIKQGIDKKFPTSSQEFRDYIFCESLVQRLTTNQSGMKQQAI